MVFFMETKLSTGTAVMDWLLEGGYEKEVITTIYGPSGSGKTNLLLLCIANSLKGQKVIYIDSEGGFSTIRFKQICCDQYESALEKIIFLKPTKFKEQEFGVKKLNSMLKDNIGAIFVDSITMLYRAELGDEDNKGLNKALVSQMRNLLEIARKHKIPIIMTTQVYTDFENKDEVKLVGGNIIKNMSKCLIELKKSNLNRIAIIKKHRSIEEEKHIMFKIVDEGIVEVEKENNKNLLTK